MIEELLGQFQKLNEDQDAMLQLATERLDLLKRDRMPEAEQLIKKELLLLFDMETGVKAIQKAIAALGTAYGFEKARIHQLFPFLSERERELLSTYKERSVRNEQLINSKLEATETLVKAKMALPEVLRNSYIQLASDYENSGKSLLNRKY